MKRILSIDDNGQDFEKLGKLLREQGFSISEIVVDETALKDASWHTEHSYLDLFENAPVGIFRSTLEGKFISVNPAVARMLKYDSPEDMIRLVNQTSIAEAVYVSSAHRQEVLENVLSHNGWQIFEERFRCKDGSIITCNFHLRANYRDGVSVELNGFIEDITERKLAEESLLMSQLIIDKASLGILRGSNDARILSVNEYWAKVLGYTAEELCSMSFFDIDPNLTEESWREHRKKLTATGSNTFESVHRRKDGTIFPVEITVNYLTFGDQVFSCSFARDITDRKRTENVIEARMRLLQFAETHTLDELLEATLNEVEELTGSCIGFYHYLDSDQQTLRLQNWSTRTKKKFCTAVGKGLHYDLSAAGVWVGLHPRTPAGDPQ